MIGQCFLAPPFTDASERPLPLDGDASPRAGVRPVVPHGAVLGAAVVPERDGVLGPAEAALEQRIFAVLVEVGENPVALVARDAGMTDWALVYQSRSGRPDDPWLEPDVSEYLRRERAAGLEAAVLCPIGFVCDHIEVLYDLDREAAHVAADAGLPMVRAAAVNDDPLFIDMMADVVIDTVERYRGRPLPLAAKGSRPP